MTIGLDIAKSDLSAPRHRCCRRRGDPAAIEAVLKRPSKSKQTSTLETSRVHSLQELTNFAEQPLEFDGLGIIVVAARCQRLFTGPCQGVRRKRNHRNPAGFRISLETSCRFPTIHHR